MQVTVRGDPDAIDAALTKELNEVRMTQTTVGIISLIVVSLLIAIVLSVDLEFSIGLAAMGAIMGVFIVSSVLKGVARREEKIRFVQALCELLGEDFAPGRKVRMTFDPRSYDATGKLRWKGTSQHGNPKYKYEDRWLDLAFRLTDGSKVRVIRRAAVKTRKGSVVRDKRRLMVRIVRPEGVDMPASESVATRARNAIVDCFHDPPEGLVLRMTPGNGNAASVRVTQLDAPILPEEVLSVITILMTPPTPARNASAQAVRLPAAEGFPLPPGRKR